MFNFGQAEDESCDKLMKHFLDLSLYLKLSGIDVINHSHLTDMEYKNLVKLDPNNSTTLAKKEAASSSSEALRSMIVLSSSYYNRFRYIIEDLRKYMLKVNNNNPNNVSSAYDMLTRF